MTATDPCKEVLEKYEDVRLAFAKLLNFIAPWFYQVLDFHFKMKLGKDIVTLLISSPKEFYKALVEVGGEPYAEMLIEVLDRKLRELKLMEPTMPSLTYIIKYSGARGEICKLLLKIAEKT